MTVSVCKNIAITAICQGGEIIYKDHHERKTILNEQNGFTARDITIIEKGQRTGDTYIGISSVGDSGSKLSTCDYLEPKPRGNIVLRTIFSGCCFLADLFAIIKTVLDWISHVNNLVDEGMEPIVAYFESADMIFGNLALLRYFVLFLLLIIFGTLLYTSLKLIFTKCNGDQFLEGIKVYKAKPKRCHCGGRMKFSTKDGINYVQCKREKSHEYMVDITQLMKK